MEDQKRGVPPPSRRARSWLSDPRRRQSVVVGGVMGALVLALAGFLFLRDTSDPESAVREYLTALQHDDLKSAYALLSTEGKAEWGSFAAYAASLGKTVRDAGGVRTFTIREARASGDGVAVTYDLLTGLGSETWQAQVLREGGAWRISRIDNVDWRYPGR